MSSDDRPGARLTAYWRLEISVPVVCDSLDEPRHVEARLTSTQSRGLAALVMGLRSSGATLVSGEPPVSGADAIRWLLERIGEAVEGQS